MAIQFLKRLKRLGPLPYLTEILCRTVCMHSFAKIGPRVSLLSRSQTHPHTKNKLISPSLSKKISLAHPKSINYFPTLLGSLSVRKIHQIDVIMFCLVWRPFKQYRRTTFKPKAHKRLMVSRRCMSEIFQMVPVLNLAQFIYLFSRHLALHNALIHRKTQNRNKLRIWKQ